MFPWRITCCLLMAAVVVGCEDDTRVSSDPFDPDSPSVRMRLIADPESPIADVPVPVGFELREKSSRSYHAAGSRYIDHVYRGRADKIDIERFYQRVMSTKGWTYRGSNMVRGVIQMRYERAEEFCDIRIDDTDGILGPTAMININIQTVGRAQPAASP